MEYEVAYLSRCPRCGDRGWECLKDHSYCVSCNYAPEFNHDHYLELPHSVLTFADQVGRGRRVPVDERGTGRIL